MSRPVAALPALLLALAAWGRVPAPPRLLSETGIWKAGVRPYSPQYPLWSDGAGKRRWVWLPPGTRIDVRRPEAWAFPVGTKFWKEFSFGGRRVETRLLWQAGPGRWVFASYHWNAGQTEADLVPKDGLPGAAPLGNGLSHSIPSRQDCRSCHDHGGVEVLGFNALQLSPDRDPLAPHAEPLEPGMLTLRDLAAEGRFRPARPEWIAHPPRIQAADPRTRAVLGYLTVNCGSCHQPGNPIPKLDLDLHHPWPLPAAQSPVLATLVGRPSVWWIPAVGAASLRVAPGHPETSSLYVRLTSRAPSTQMPPLGTVKVDDEAARLVEAWIRDLK